VEPQSPRASGNQCSLTIQAEQAIIISDVRHGAAGLEKEKAPVCYLGKGPFG
jgi:hypothetical protein